MTTRTLKMALALALVAPAGLVAADWGNLKGKFVIDGKAPEAAKLNVDKDKEVCAKNPPVDEAVVVGDGGALANVFVYLRTDKVAEHADYQKTAKDEIAVDNLNCRFEPHASVLRTSQTLVLKNSDPVGHNSKVNCLKNPGLNPLIAANGSVKANFAQEENLPTEVNCNIHGWMKGYVLIRKGPYAAASAKDGTFEIKNLPAGSELEFQIWQEKAGYVKDVQMSGAKADPKCRFKIKLKAGDNDLGTIKCPARMFQKK